MSTLRRPAYDPLEVRTVADAANLIAQEARDAGCPVQRLFNDTLLEGRPDWTAAHTVMWWHVGYEQKRMKGFEKEINRLNAEIDRLTRSNQ